VRVIRAHIQEGKSNTLSDLRQRQAFRDLRVAETIDEQKQTKGRKKKQWQQT